MIETPADHGLFMPGEYAPHARTWMSWPSRRALWGRELPAAQRAHRDVALAIARFEPVTLLVDPMGEAGAHGALQGADNVTVMTVALDESWLRDNGPSFLRARNGHAATGPAAVHWGFNAWGGKSESYARDAAAPRAMLEAVGARRFVGPQILEGGSIQVDGEGTLIATEECLLNGNRNPHLNRAEIEAHLRHYLGIETIIWLPHGVAHDDTDGHVDNVASFVRPGVVTLYAPGADDTGRRMAENLSVLKQARDARGRPLEIIELPGPERRRSYPEDVPFDGPMPGSYVNFYLCNGAVLVPGLDDPGDERAAAILRDAFPEREIVQPETLAVLGGGGNIHCITQQQPA